MDEEKFKRWTNDPAYRAQVIRELEQSRKITRLSKEEFGHLVY